MGRVGGDSMGKDSGKASPVSKVVASKNDKNKTTATKSTSKSGKK